MHVTVISPGEAVSSNKDTWSAHTIYSHHFRGTGEVRFHGFHSHQDDIFHTNHYRKKALSKPLLQSTSPTTPTNPSKEDNTFHALTEEVTCMLWHQGLCHLHLRVISDMHKSVEGA